MYRLFSAKTALLAALILGTTPALASDPPHEGVSSGIECSSCHQGHRGQGMNLTNVKGNSHLCLNCHKDAQTNLPAFVEGDQANRNTGRGFHHRWDSGVAGFTLKTNISNGSTGEVRSEGDYVGADKKSWAITFTGDGTATTATFTWVGTGGTGGSGGGTCGTAVPLNEGVTLSCDPEALGATGACGQFFCNGDIFTVFASDVASNPTLPQLTLRMPDGKVVCSTCHNQHLQTAAPYTSRNVNGDDWRHFMQIDNDAGQLCRECHSDRFPDTGDPNYPFDLTRSHTTTARSHPVGIALNANGKGYDRAEPLDANGALQSVGDGINSNDLLLGTGGVVTCLTCHGIHSGAADGNSKTE